MNAVETLAATRLSPVSPYVPAREEWLLGWIGPAVVDWRNRGFECVAYIDRGDIRAYATGPCLGDRLSGVQIENVRLDTRRREVRHLLVDHGCPAWARDCAPAVWAWTNGVEGAGVLGGYVPSDLLVGGRPQLWRRAAVCGLPLSVLVASDGWSISRNGRHAYSLADYVAHGPETGDLGRACADLAAIRAGCVLEEVDGWYVPDDKIGWWPKNLETP